LRKKKNKDSSEKLHEALESHYWVENLLGRPNGVKKGVKKKRKMKRSLGENLS